MMKRLWNFQAIFMMAASVLLACRLYAQAPAASGMMSPEMDSHQKPSSYAPTNEGDFSSTESRMKSAKPEIMRRQMDLLNDRYDLSDRPAPGVTMDRQKPIQEGVRVKLPSGVTWDNLQR